MDYLKWANETFAADIFAMKTTGIKIDEVSLNYAKCSLEITENHLNAAGSVMGGVLFTLADFTFAVAANSGGVLTVSLTSQINYLSIAQGKVLIAEAICSKTGKNVCFYDIVIKDDFDNIVASVATTGFRKQ